MTAKRKPRKLQTAVRSVLVAVMVEPEVVARIDALRRAKPEMPTRSTLCRTLILQGLGRAERSG